MDQRSFAPTHGLSQLITSFIARKSQGILRTPFLTFLLRSLENGNFLQFVLCLSRLLLAYRLLSLVFACVKMSKISLPTLLGGSVENNGFEQLTLCLQSRCSSQLS